MKMTRITSVAAIALFAAASLAGCTPGAPAGAPTSSASESPSPAESATPTPTPTVDPSTVADFIVVSGSGVGVGAVNSFSIVQIPYSTDGATAAAQLSDAIGVEPTVSTVPASGSCSRDSTVYDFGGLVFRAPGAITTPGGQQFNAIVSAAETPGGLDLETTYGQRVGSLVDDFMSTVPGADLQDLGGGYLFIYFDRQNPGESEADAWGAIAKVESGAIARIDAPLYYYGDC